MAAGGVKPRHADAITFLDMSDAIADTDDIADTFVAGNEGQCRLDWPVAVSRMQIGVTYAGRLDVDENLTAPGLRDGDLFDT